jgi:hypothetical protein
VDGYKGNPLQPDQADGGLRDGMKMSALSVRQEDESGDVRVDGYKGEPIQPDQADGALRDDATVSELFRWGIGKCTGFLFALYCCERPSTYPYLGEVHTTSEYKP